MPLFKDPHCILHTEYLVAAWAINGEGPDDGTYHINVLLQVGTKRERVGWSYPTQTARDAALLAIGALTASVPAVWDSEAN